jgi:hypothetical protein
MPPANLAVGAVQREESRIAHRFYDIQRRSRAEAPFHQQIPQKQHLQNSIKTNNFNSFAINTYKKQGVGRLTERSSTHADAKTPRK